MNFSRQAVSFCDRFSKFNDKFPICVHLSFGADNLFDRALDTWFTFNKGCHLTNGW